MYIENPEMTLEEMNAYVFGPGMLAERGELSGYLVFSEEDAGEV